MSDQPGRRRAHGEGGVHWDAKRQRFIASKTVGYDARGKRIVRKASGKTESAALRELAKRVRDYSAGLVVGSERFTVKQAVEDWLAYGNPTAGESTMTKCQTLATKHIIPHLGGRRLRDLRADEVDRWLHSLAGDLSTRSLLEVRSILSRSVRRAMMRGYADRNVVELCAVPRGRKGRESKSLSVQQARDVLTLTRGHWMHSYIVVSLLTGARTEELRALRWRDVHLDQQRSGDLQIPPHLDVIRSVRQGGDTKTRKSRRSIALPKAAVEVLAERRALRARQLERAGEPWDGDALVFGTSAGTTLDAANVRRAFRSALKRVPSVRPEEWTPREMRHSFVSLLSDSGVGIDEIARLVGHTSGSQVTERVYRKQLRPVIQTGATVMDSLFPQSEEGSGSC